MGLEIERKFLVQSEAWRSAAQGAQQYRQGYLSLDPERTVRVRVAGQEGFLTVKGISRGTKRAEFEYPIPLQDAAHMLEHLCLRPLIEKLRHRVPWAGLMWEIDEFGGDNRGLVVAEVELADEAQRVQLPEWVGREVSDDARYFNINLVTHPFAHW